MNLKTWRKMTKEERRQALSEMPATEKKDLSKKIMRAHNRQAKDEAMKSLGLTKVIGAISGQTYWE